MKADHMKRTGRSSFHRNAVAAAILVTLGSHYSTNVALANGAFGTNTDITGTVINVPTYYANSPQGIQPAFDPVTHAPSAINPLTKTPFLTVDTGKPIRKFVDSLGGVYNGLENLPGMTDLQSGIPVAITEKWTNPLTGAKTNDDYYEIAIVEYTERLHTDLANPTRLRGYVQIETPAIVAGGLKDITGLIGSEHIAATYPDGMAITDANGNQVFFVHPPHFLGPVILAASGNPVRLKFTNYLPYTDATGKSVGSRPGAIGGEAFVPVDETIAGGGPIYDKTGQQIFQKDSLGNLVLLNGMPIPIKMAQNRTAIHWHGGDTPWISDGTPHQWFTPRGDISYSMTDADHPNGMGVGDSFQNVPDMPDPGQGSQTLYFPVNLSGRLMMYHDHVSGLTKVNVYEGEAAGLVVYDPTELTLVANALGTPLSKTLGGSGPYASLPTGLLDAVGIPLVVQDKTFVPKNIGPNAMASDGTTPASQDAKWDLTHWGREGDFFFPHVYETNQDPNSADGTNPVGRWDWGPWFWPVFPAQMSLPSGAYGDATATPEAFLDTPIVNGQPYPTMTVDPKTYRFRILSVANDRSFNFGLYQAVDANGVVCDGKSTPAVSPIAPGGVGTPAACTEVKMVPAAPTAGFPATWPVDGRVGGVPDPATAGPDIVQIGNEGGLLPQLAVWKSQPVVYDQNVRNITVFNILNHDLLLMGGERADVLIDFSKYAGQTLILYNDAPAPMPGYDPRIDYYTGIGDQTGVGGAYDTLPGYGPNTRTIMQIKVNGTNTSGSGGALDTAALAAALPAAYAKTQPAPIIPEAVYNPAFATTSVNNYASIGTGSGALNTGPFTYKETVNGVTTTKQLPVINKAIQELFDPVYGRMNATLAAELPFSTATVATTIPLAYVDTPVERLDAIKDGETQIWKVTHNGVDAHPVHFHLVNVQVINRVAWDGTIRPPAPNEVGWKETLRMNPLEDVYVAVKAVRPVVPFGVPSSQRLLDPSQLKDSAMGFTNIDPTTGGAPTTQTYLVGGVMTAVPTVGGIYTNQFTDFDNEYVWHCHILGHEEQDFMRPFVFHPTVLVPDAPAAVSVTGSTVSWTDTTPFGGQDAQGIPTAGTNAAYPMPTSSPKNEIGFKIYDGANALIGTVGANATSWTDATGALNLTGAQVVAYNAAGNSIPGTSATVTAAGALVGTGTVTPPASTPGAAPVAPAGPTGLTQTLNSDGSVTLAWTAIPGATGYLVSIIETPLAPPSLPAVIVPVAATPASYTTGILNPGSTYAFAVSATTLSGPTAGTSVAGGLTNAPTSDPVAFAGSAGTSAGYITLVWANNPANKNNVSGLLLTWTNGSTSAVASKTFAPTTTGATVIGLTPGVAYSFTLQAKSNVLAFDSTVVGPVPITAP
jgi:FtsP/CotA-like multicopper oxidase with cupredoxin domain